MRMQMVSAGERRIERDSIHKQVAYGNNTRVHNLSQEVPDKLDLRSDGDIRRISQARSNR